MSEVVSLEEFEDGINTVRAVHNGSILEVEAQKHREVTWDGECPGPTVIGRIELPVHDADVLQSELTFPYSAFERNYYDEASEPHYVAQWIDDDDQDQETILSPQTSRILNQIERSLSEVVTLDIQHSTQPNDLEVKKIALWGGVYSGEEFGVHTDKVGHMFRYVVTMLGSPTEFVSEKVNPDLFIREDGLVPNNKANQWSREPVAICNIVRFLAYADPHTSPSPMDPEKRLFAEATVGIK